ncbi:glycosyl transferase family 2 [Leucobacter luti]|uniref:glycosyltransferase family 2 protein n=2 Tax=Leucobacter luti TaxID=340320 RepID=UPI0010ECBD86|nr:glycosyltransferase family 2 protein [Leucobacter luti]MCW2289710.1 cellulose synthase/poly-beta-1,6-N-acetylglucosamine synthase-like glycosyltransferase [Leucobacter luti]TCK37880.1 glycosyl transferase family 2 [Leucobacter luti]
MTEDAPQPNVRRRQWGAERRSEPLAIVPSRPSPAAIVWARLAIVITVLSWFLYMLTTIIRMVIEGPQESFVFHLQTWVYGLTVTALTFSAVMYLTARYGALVRFREHRRVERALLDEHFARSDDRVTVLIPSYDEEPDVVRYTLWSAALQEFPDISIVLLIDDRATGLTGDALERLERTRALGAEISAELERPRAAAQAALDAFLAEAPEHPGPADAKRAADAYAEAAVWLDDFVAAEAITDHMAEFFAEYVLLGLSNDLRLTRLALDAAHEQGGSPDRERLHQLHQRLVWIFSAQLGSFERKQYASLSQEPNKAMNLNSYISLMGGTYRIVRDTGEQILEELGPDEDPATAELVIPDSRYLLTLDADSQLLREYCLRLVYLLEQPENQRVAVTQTPYSSFRGASTRIERMAGATTDLQHIQHQGLTYFNATFWVGANAVIRTEALDDIAVTQTVGGFEITTYVQDRTVIEDTESSIDLGLHGWTLENYPERLSYSATPPDFGSLVVQRRRWANGGLLIMPKFFEMIRARRGTADRVRLTEKMLRSNYMSSLAWASFGLIFLLFFPFDSRLLSPLVVAAALPYFLSMGLDLRASGHRFTDIFRIYGFNLILLPVNLAGVLKSVQQGATGAKIPFARTPKVTGRTAAPAIYVTLPYVIVAFSVFIAVRDSMAGNWGNAAFAAFNAIMATWAILSYIGIRASIADAALGLVGWLYVPIKPKRVAAKSPVDPTATVNWQAILYHGDRRLSRDLARTSDRRRRLSGVRAEARDDTAPVPIPVPAPSGRARRRAARHASGQK